MKFDFFQFGGGGGGGPVPEAAPPSRVKFSRRLLERYFRHRLETRPLDDASRPVRVGLITAGIIVGLFVVFAMLLPMSGAAIAEAEVSVSGDQLNIQPEGSALVSEVLVQEGQVVRAGQPLVRMNGMRSGAKLQQAQARRDALRAQEARLIAERDGAEELVFPGDLASRSNDPVALASMRAQFGIFERRRNLLAADRTISDAQLTAASARRLSAETQLALMRDELAAFRGLLARGFASKTRVRALERTEAQLQGELASGTSALTEAQMNQTRTRDGQVMEIVRELATVQDQLAQLNPELDVTRYEADRDVLRAPVDGRVAGLAELGPGTVVSGGQTLMQILPQDRALIVDAQIKPADIDDVVVGGEAHVRFTTANPHGVSSFTGKVVRLSPVQTEVQGGGGYFRAQIALDDPAAVSAAGITLQPGLPATVNITTEARSLWDYLMSPLGDAFSRSMREE